MLTRAGHWCVLWVGGGGGADMLIAHCPTLFIYIHFNIILPSKPRSSKWSLPLKFFNENIVCISHLYHVYLANFILTVLILIICGRKITKFLIMQFSSAPCWFLSLKSNYFPQDFVILGMSILVTWIGLSLVRVMWLDVILRKHKSTPFWHNI